MNLRPRVQVVIPLSVAVFTAGSAFVPARTVATVEAVTGVWMPLKNNNANWTQATLRAVFFADPETGWIVGDSPGEEQEPVILKTVNGGDSWTPQTANIQPIEDLARLNDVAFTDPSNGFAVGSRDGAGHDGPFGVNNAGSRATIIRTNDGGATWNKVLDEQHRDAQTAVLESISCTYVTRIRCHAVGYERFYDTTDGGETWQTGMANPVDGPVSGERDTFTYKGASGVFFTDGPAAPDDASCKEKNGSTSAYAEGCYGHVVDFGGGIWRTTDGKNWTQQYPSHDPNLEYGFRDVWFLDHLRGFAVGGLGPYGCCGSAIITTSDGGMTWTPQQVPRETVSAQLNDSASPGHSHLESVTFPDAEHGWAAGNAGAITSTSDGGRTWKAEFACEPATTACSSSSDDRITEKLRDIHFVKDPTTGSHVGYAVGDGGTILKSVEPMASSSPTVPGTPTDLTATTASSARIDLSWSDVSNETGYRIERSPDGSSGWSEIATTGANVTTYSDTGLAANTTYYYRVRAFNSAGSSDYSNVASATTHAGQSNEGAPAAPTNLTASAPSSSRIDLSWSDVSSETGYRVERSSDGSSGWSEIATTGVNVTTYSNTGLAANTTYYYRVRARNSVGSSGYSNVASATTPPSEAGGSSGGSGSTQNSGAGASPDASPNGSPSSDGTATSSSSPQVTTTLTSDRGTVRFNEDFTLSGVVSADEGCSGPYTIEIAKRRHGTESFVTQRGVEVDPDGSWETKMASPVNASYQATVTPPLACGSSASSPVDVLVRAHIDVAVPRRCHAPQRIVGTVKPRQPGTSVLLKRRGRDKFINRGRLDRRSRFSLSVPSCSGSFVIVWPTQGLSNIKSMHRFWL